MHVYAYLVLLTYISMLIVGVLCLVDGRDFVKEIVHVAVYIEQRCVIFIIPYCHGITLYLTIM